MSYEIEQNSSNVDPKYLDLFKKQHKHRLLFSFIWAFRGIYYTAKTQPNFNIQVFAAIFVGGLSFYYRISIRNLSIIILSIFLVLICEMINTALEYMIDLFEKKFNVLALIAKDIAAGFVFLAAVHATVQGLLIFGPHLIRSISQLIK